ncbi:MAG: glutamyl-tRNA reductase [Acidobacteriota bacterium]
MTTASPPQKRRDAPTLLLVGTDHRNSPLELRERVSFGAAEGEELLVRLLARPEISEALLVSTCNRTELLLAPRDEEPAYHTALDVLFRTRAPEVEEQGRFFTLHDGEAARRLLRVASGLESMVLGEPEILGQMKQAAAAAEAAGSVGTVLKRLLRTAVGTGGRVRAETAIGAGAVSLGYATVELGRNIFKSLENCSALVIGAGETGRMVARDLSERGIGSLWFTNRSRERAEAFMREFPHARQVDFEERLSALTHVDIVTTTTSATEPILRKEDVAAALRKRSARAMLIVDLGVPRNVEPTVGKLPSVFLHDIDALQSLIERNLRRRREEAPKVEAIVEEELQRFLAWYRGLEAEPVLARLQRRAEKIRVEEIERVRSRFPEATHGELDLLTRSLIKKILHHPSMRLRGRAGEDTLAHLDLVRELFSLDDEEENGEPRP